MKKVIVLNEFKRSEIPVGCSNLFSSVNPIDHLRGDIKKFEVNASQKFNTTGNQGFEVYDERVYGFNIIDSSSDKETEVLTSAHSVYLCRKSDVAINYSVYLGPIVVLPKENVGCGELKIPACKKSEKNKSKGCNTTKVTSEQYINFFNNSLNSDTIKAINSHNGWRNNYSPEVHDFVYSSFESSNENVDKFFNLIEQQFNNDISRFVENGMKFDQNISIASNEGNFSKALLFSSKSSQNIEINRSNSIQAFLSGFELLYLKASKSLLEILMAIPFINIIAAILKMFTGNDEKEDKTQITPKNIEILENIYENDINRQDQIIQQIEASKQAVIGKLPVTFAIPREGKKGILQMISGGLIPSKTEYDLVTTEIDLGKK